VFVSLFPQLFAGPIERASHLLPQVESPRRFSWSAVESGVGLALWGVFKKLVIADTLAPYVDKVFLLPDAGAPLVWAATFAFMVQLYADFSGYTDIARGTARILGFDLVRNFDEPYVATTTQEFWQRWHMSLSSWIRDYLLGPLLGRSDVISPLRFAVAITIAMVAMGIWHGAGWNFVLFGLFQAACILTYAVVMRILPQRVRSIPYGRVPAAAFHLVFVGGIGAFLFREHDLGKIAAHLTSHPFVGTLDEWRLNLAFVVEHVARRTVIPRLRPTPWWLPLETTVWSGWALLALLSYRTGTYDFVYFQF
jgi:D-alanyl-lipoteichoic acid acyltransferase DltB (MBOAT superfamily)